MKTIYLDDDLLCRYIPENFYSDFAISDGSGGQGSGKGGVPDYLETVVAGKGITSTTVSAQPTQLQPNSLQPGCYRGWSCSTAANGHPASVQHGRFVTQH